MSYSSRMAAKVSACLTVSIPRSASRSSSRSSISGGYPVCSATTSNTRIDDRIDAGWSSGCRGWSPAGLTPAGSSRGRLPQARSSRGAATGAGAAAATGAGAGVTAGADAGASTRAGGPSSRMRKVRCDDLEVGFVVAADLAQPCRPAVRVGDPVGVAQLVGLATGAVGGRDPPQQRHADLRAEPGAEPQRIAHRVAAALREVEVAQIGIDLLHVGDGRHDPGLQRLDGEDVLDADPHRVTGEALAVGDDDGVGVGAEDVAERVDLGLGAASPGGRVGLVGDEDHLAGQLTAVESPTPFGVGHQVLHHVADVAARRVGCRGRRCWPRPSRARRRSGSRPRSRAAARSSTTTAAAPMPTIMPWRRRSKGSAASSTTSSVAAAPVARKPVPIQGSIVSLVTSSAAMTMTRSQRPNRIQSSARATAWVVLAHAALTWVLGPRAPMYSANCECPIESTLKMKRRSYS